MLHRQKAFLKPGHSFGIGTEYSFGKKKSMVEEFP